MNIDIYIVFDNGQSRCYFWSASERYERAIKLLDMLARLGRTNPRAVRFAF
jgi:hypothetical protein